MTNLIFGLTFTLLLIESVLFGVAFASWVVRTYHQSEHKGTFLFLWGCWTAAITAFIFFIKMML